MIKPVVKTMMKYDVSVIQLPCPDLGAYGLDRPATDKDFLEYTGFRMRCNELAESVAELAGEYESKGYRILGLIGMSGRPLCSAGLCRSEKGIFFEELEVALKGIGLNIATIEFERTDIEGSLNGLEKIVAANDI